ncbi:MAG: PQQ-dependent sugar dehydrogenase [Gemmatimonadetes bacterium]|nr:PQQ-dependent sugar dehydrogenase [Gemmatimonadota bacterium]
MRQIRTIRTLASGVLLLAVADCGSGDPTGPGGNNNGASDLSLEEVVTGLNAPVFLTHAGDSRLFIVEQGGRIRIVENGQLLGTPFLDISNIVLHQGEQGLLSMAFHPDYSSNGFFYVYHTDLGGDSRVARYSGSGNTADENSGLTIMTIAQPFSNHNGGQITFGADGMLYVALGDGGSGGDPLGNGQNTATLLGSLLRIDVDNPDPGMNYGIPADNPFAGSASARGEIWIYGLRNPWRFAFDDVDGLLYVADVGQNRFEEITIVRADESGVNFGWNIMEGMSCFNSGTCDTSGLVMPALQYDNTGFAGNCSITGGYVYRGSAITGLQGHYFYSDFCGGFLRSFRFDVGAVADARDWGLVAGSVTSFGEDVAGELYMLVAEGSVFKIVAAQ